MRVLQARSTKSEFFSSNFPGLRGQRQKQRALIDSVFFFALGTALLSSELRIVLSLEREMQKGVVERRLAMRADQLLVLSARVLTAVLSQQASRADEPVSTEMLLLPSGHPDEFQTGGEIVSSCALGTTLNDRSGGASRDSELEDIGMK